MIPRLERVPPPAVKHKLPEVRRWLEMATKRCKDEDLSDVENQIHQGIAQLWITYLDEKPTGIVVTSIGEFPGRSVLELRYLAGDRFPDWIVLQERLAEWARTRGCSAIRLRGRKGWLRMLRGWRWRVTSYEMELGV